MCLHDLCLLPTLTALNCVCPPCIQMAGGPQYHSAMLACPLKAGDALDAARRWHQVAAGGGAATSGALHT